jgi:hypothetical protein
MRCVAVYRDPPFTPNPGGGIDLRLSWMIEDGSATGQAIVNVANLVQDEFFLEATAKSGVATTATAVSGVAVTAAEVRLLNSPAIKNNFGAGVDPLVTDDSGGGYSVGSEWVNTVTDAAFVCVDATVGAAIWMGVSNTGGNATTTESADYIPLPEVSFVGQSTFATTTSLVGASYIARRRLSVSRILFEQTAGGGGGTLRIAIYQAPGGGSGLANKLVEIAAFPAGANGVKDSVFDAAATLVLVPGIFYVLYGRSSAAGSWTARVWQDAALNLLNTVTDVNTHPIIFTTVLSALVAAPATFDPRQTPTGAATQSSTDIALLHRYRS